LASAQSILRENKQNKTATEYFLVAAFFIALLAF